MRKTPRLGQHFLTAPWAASKLAYAAHIEPGDTVLEIGPGKGALTKVLLAHGAHIVAIEKDREIVETLKRTFAKEIVSGQLSIVAADIRDIRIKTGKMTSGARRGESGARDVQKSTLSKTQRLRNDADEIILPVGYVLAANIPYYITGEIIRSFLTASVQPKTIALLVQKEVAQRIISSRESILSLSVKAYGTPRMVEKVSRKHFSPPPKVDSAILAIDDISKDFFSDITEEHFFEVLHIGFSSKRKMLANNLSTKWPKDFVTQSMTHCEILATARAETVPLEKWKCLARELPTENSPSL